jgi:hypothetical protein
MYMFGLAAICWALWKTRNKTCFKKKHIHSPGDLVFLACAFMKYWAGLFPEETRNLVAAGTEAMMKVTKSILDGARTAKRLKQLTGGDVKETKQRGAICIQDHGGGD